MAGRATQVTRADDWEHVHDLLLFPWHLAPKPFFVRIDPEAVTGRRFRAVYAGAADDDMGPPAKAEDDAAGSYAPARTVAPGRRAPEGRDFEPERESSLALARRRREPRTAPPTCC